MRADHHLVMRELYLTKSWLVSVLYILQSYVREQILQTVAVILKRATLEKKGKSCDGLFEDVTTLISSGNITMVSHVSFIVMCDFILVQLTFVLSIKKN